MFLFFFVLFTNLLSEMSS